MKNYALQLLLFLFSYITPKKKNLIILGAGDAKQFQGNPKYVYRFLCLNPGNIEFYWSAKSKSQQEFLNKNSSPYINPYSFKGFFKILRAQYLLIEKSSYDVYYIKSIRGRFNFIQSWHGSPFKKVGVHASEHLSDQIHMSANKESAKYRFLKKIKFFSRHKYKMIVSPSKAVSEIFQGAFENPNTEITGYPRNDVLFNQQLASTNYGTLFGFDIYDKIILYAPTFRDNQDAVSPFSENIATYNQQLADSNYLLVVKKHPWEKKFVVPKGLSNILDVGDKVDDIQELLPFVDILITDYSSSFYDHMLTGNHTIFYPYDFDEYIKNCRGIYFDYFEELQGPFAMNEAELFALIFSTAQWTEDKAYKERFKTVLDKYNYYKDGESSQRLLTKLFPNFKIG